MFHSAEQSITGLLWSPLIYFLIQGEKKLLTKKKPPSKTVIFVLSSSRDISIILKVPADILYYSRLSSIKIPKYQCWKPETNSYFPRPGLESTETTTVHRTKCSRNQERGFNFFTVFYSPIPNCGLLTFTLKGFSETAMFAGWRLSFPMCF